MFCREAVGLFNLGISNTYNFDTWTTVHKVYPVEQIKESITSFLREECEIPLGPSVMSKLEGLGRRYNSFKRKKPKYQDYYTPETKDLVYKKDRWIIDKYGYTF